ncbi:Hsp20/alpha crystallin family protein [Gracilinema caldarium]|jgi:HSP20 family protein|uniref:Hsp20/alpha crystallin family protein n=1 Tax=Gracilinema caldarium TaxID=215591 RepID=UPI0026E9F604|nr:Hsp20/alpha crystallin family protein [Gracilinema caldarium]
MNEVMEKKQENKVRMVQPACAICEDNGQILVRVEMPGVDKDGIEVSVEKNELVIKGKPAATPVEGTYLIRERQTGEYHKRFIIDETIDREKIQAVMNDGVLQLTLSIKEAAKPRKIEIK